MRGAKSKLMNEKNWWQERKEGGRSPATRSVLCLSEINSGDRSVRSCTIKKGITLL